MLPAKEETVLQGMIDSISEIGKSYEMEMNKKKKNKVTRISRQPSPIKITIYIKKTGKCGIFPMFRLYNNKQSKIYM